MKLDKIINKLPEDVIHTIGRMDMEALRKTIADSTGAIDKARQERDANPDYVKAKEDAKALSEGLKEVKSYQSAKITCALLVLRSLEGVELTGEEEEILATVKV